MTSTVELPWPSPARAWYGVGVFTLTLVFLTIDRQIMNLLVGPIKHDLGMTDTQISLLLGFAFAVFSAFLGIPIARLADTKSRRLVIALGAATAGVMTAACGLAQNFWQLFTARVAVGAGDACNAPATYSILADSFPREKLPRAASVLSTGFALGTGISLIVGATVIQLVSETPTVQLPLLGEIRSWQFTFVIVGFPGLLFAALMATVQEPRRRGLLPHGTVSSTTGQAKSLPIKTIIRFLFDDGKSYGPIFIVLAVRAMLGLGVIVWIPTFFIRTYGWTASQIGYLQGLILLVISPLGLICGGLLAEWLAKKGYDDANMRVVLISSLAIAPFCVLYPLMPGPYLALVLYAAYVFLTYLGPGPQNAALQIITPNQMRAQVTALFIFIFNLVGFGVGPTLIAVLTDYVLGSEIYLRYSLSIAGLILAPLAALVTWYGLKPYGASVIRAHAWAGQSSVR